LTSFPPDASADGAAGTDRLGASGAEV